jgi:hypothetical protein
MSQGYKYISYPRYERDSLFSIKRLHSTHPSWLKRRKEELRPTQDVPSSPCKYCSTRTTSPLRRRSETSGRISWLCLSCRIFEESLENNRRTCWITLYLQLYQQLVTKFQSIKVIHCQHVFLSPKISFDQRLFFVARNF